MKRYLLFLTLATLASCTENLPEGSTLPGGTRSSVRFATRVETRGVSTTQDNIQEFGVFCYDLKSSTWDPATSIPNKMNDLKVTRISNSDDWTYGEPIDWEGGDGRRFSFLGYAPHAAGPYAEPDQANGNNLEVVTPVAGIPTLNYQTMDYVPMQVDLLLAVPRLSIPVQEKVFMQFNHALSQVRFRAWSAQDFVKVKKIEISNIKYQATFKLDGVMTAAADEKTFVLDLDRSLSTNEQNPTDLSDGSNAFLLLPQDLTSNTTAQITVTYEVGIEEKTSKPYTIVQNWTPGKAYTYTLALGGTPTEEMLITSVTMSDWIVDSEEEMTTTPPLPPPAVGDYYYSDGTYSTVIRNDKTATGMIFYVNPNDAEKYKVMSLEEDALLHKWCANEQYKVLNAQSESDGKANVAAIKAVFDAKVADNSTAIAEATFIEAFYPAGYCYTYTGRAGIDPEGTWYLPAVNDLQYLYCAHNGHDSETWSNTYPNFSVNKTNQDNWNSRMLIGGATKTITDQTFWSSTEYGDINSNYAWPVTFTDGRTGYGYGKYTELNVRCIRDM